MRYKYHKYKVVPNEGYHNGNLGSTFKETLVHPSWDWGERHGKGGRRLICRYAQRGLPVAHEPFSYIHMKDMCQESGYPLAGPKTTDPFPPKDSL